MPIPKDMEQEYDASVALVRSTDILRNLRFRCDDGVALLTNSLELHIYVTDA